MGKVLFGLWLIFLVGFVALALYDARWFLLSDRIVFPLIVLAFVQVMLRVFFFSGGWPLVAASVWGVLFTAGLFFLIFEVSDGSWIGFGDVKLSIILGLLVGGPLKALLLIFIASLLGSLVALPLLVRRRATARTPLPFGPFLLLATVVVMLFGSHIVAWYGSMLLLQ
jgi:prepilin signal peptidase PulO-like enzyme (type II secretory pathway)